MIAEVSTGLLAGLAFGAVGLVLLVLGYLLVDTLTPGRLGELIWDQRNANAAIVLTSGLLAVGIIATTAILVSHDGLAAGLLSTFGYGVLGLVLMAIAFVVIDVLTPGRLADTLVDPCPHPAAWVTAGVHLVVGAVVAAAIS